VSYEVIAHGQGCEGGSCPTIYLDKTRGVIAIQGYTPGASAPATAAGEGLVEIPVDVFRNLIEQVQA
jgi:hypothetical protein